MNLTPSPYNENTKDLRKYLIESIRKTITECFFFVSRPSNDDITPLENISKPIDRYSYYEYKQNILLLSKINLNSSLLLEISSDHTWTSGKEYKVWNYDVNSSNSKDYIVYHNNNFFICIGKPESTANTYQSTEEPKITNSKMLLADGYRWLYIGTVSDLDFFNYGIDNSLAGTSYYPITNSIAQPFGETGAVLNIEIVSPGSGWTSTAELVVTQNSPGVTNHNFEADIVINGGQLEEIKIIKNGENFHKYGFKIELIDPNAPATAVQPELKINLTPYGGLGSNLINELGIKDISVNCEIPNIKDLPNNFKFNRVGIVKNIKDKNGNEIDKDIIKNNEGILKAYKVLTLDKVYSSDIDVNKIYTGSKSGAKCKIFSKYNDKIFVYQDMETGFHDFEKNDILTSDLADSYVVLAYQVEDVDKLSGDVLFYQNVASVTKVYAENSDGKITSREKITAIIHL